MVSDLENPESITIMSEERLAELVEEEGLDPNYFDDLDDDDELPPKITWDGDDDDEGGYLQ